MIKFNCPACGQKIEAANEAISQKLKCPSCEHVFVPDVPAIPIIPKKFSKVDDIRNTADNFRAAAFIMAMSGSFAMLVAIVNSLGSTTEWAAWGFAVSLLGAALWLYMIAQIIHIRANTHK